MLRSLALLAVLLSASVRASAQGAGSVYVFAGAGAAHQDGPSGEMHVTYVTAPGGTSLSWLWGAACTSPR